jgi:hypothetical protein
MKTHRSLVYAVIALFSAIAAHAQRGFVPVRGIVFDSLRGRPLRNAFVTVAGAGSFTTDAQGRFHFDAVPTGKQTFVAQHPLLDSIGLSGLTTAATVSEASDEVRLAIPSFATMWGIACKGHAPKDSGIVFGTVRDAARGAPVANATIEVSWSDLALDRRRGVRQRQWHIVTETNAQGGFSACGIPPERGLQIHAGLDSNETGYLDIPPVTARVQRRDLFIGPTNSPDSTNRGSIRGVVTTAAGVPWSDARITTVGLDEVRTDAEGRFMIHGVAPGTRQMEIFSIGATPALALADVSPRATTDVTIQMEKVPMLSGMRTSATRGARVAATEFEERRKSGLGYVRDSTDIVRYDQFLNVFRDIPSLTTRYNGGVLSITVPDGKGGQCAPDVMIDGAAAAFGHLIDLYPKEVAAVEVYARVTQIPARFQKPGVRAQCGMILVWTKYGFRNR